MSTTVVATLHHLEDYRRRKALRDCGQDSRMRQFLWVHPHNGEAMVAVFRPAIPDAQAALQRARLTGRIG